MNTSTTDTERLDALERFIAENGGKNKTAIRNATPPEFRDLLIAIARSARPTQLAEAS